MDRGATGTGGHPRPPCPPQDTREAVSKAGGRGRGCVGGEWGGGPSPLLEGCLPPSSFYNRISGGSISRRARSFFSSLGGDIEGTKACPPLARAGGLDKDATHITMVWFVDRGAKWLWGEMPPPKWCLGRFKAARGERERWGRQLVHFAGLGSLEALLSLPGAPRFRVKHAPATRRVCLQRRCRDNGEVVQGKARRRGGGGRQYRVTGVDVCGQHGPAYLGTRRHVLGG